MILCVLDFALMLSTCEPVDLQSVWISSSCSYTGCRK